MSTIAKFFVDKHWKSKLKLFLGFFLQTPATELTVVLFFFLSLSLSLFFRLPLVAQVVLPTSMLFGFMYTMKHGEAPFDIRGSNTSVRGVSTAAKDALPLHSVSMRFNWDTNQTKD